MPHEKCALTDTPALKKRRFQFTRRLSPFFSAVRKRVGVGSRDRALPRTGIFCYSMLSQRAMVHPSTVGLHRLPRGRCRTLTGSSKTSSRYTEKDFLRTLQAVHRTGELIRWPFPGGILYPLRCRWLRPQNLPPPARRSFECWWSTE